MEALRLSIMAALSVTRRDKTLVAHTRARMHVRENSQWGRKKRTRDRIVSLSPVHLFFSSSFERWTREGLQKSRKLSLGRNFQSDYPHRRDLRSLLDEGRLNEVNKKFGKRLSA